MADTKKRSKVHTLIFVFGTLLSIPALGIAYCQYSDGKIFAPHFPKNVDNLKNWSDYGLRRLYGSVNCEKLPPIKTYLDVDGYHIETDYPEWRKACKVVIDAMVVLSNNEATIKLREKEQKQKRIVKEAYDRLKDQGLLEN